jgi:carbamoyltransferase
MWILGISALYHDSAAAIIHNGHIVAAAQEERFTRIKHDPAFPTNAIQFVIDKAGIRLSEVAAVVFYDKPFLKFERLLESYLATAPKGFRSFCKAMPVWLDEKLFLKNLLVKQLKAIDADFSRDRCRFSEHHFSHAASAYYPSPFDDAVVLTLDGVGEWATTTVARGYQHQLNMVKEIHFPHSLGLLYSAVTYYLGFKVNSGEYKVMGLAPYGSPRYTDLIFKHLLDLKADGSFRLNLNYFDYVTGLTMTNKRFERLFGQPRRQPETEALTTFHMDMAASVQAATEQVVLTMVRSLAQTFDTPNLCLAGGVALNCVANGKIRREGMFSNIWVQPAAGDAGGALGAALGYWHQILEKPRLRPLQDQMQGSYLGPEYTLSQIQSQLAEVGAQFSAMSTQEMLKTTAQALADGKAVGWFQGRMEFGPRALGGRSILGDPRSDTMQKNLNLKVKFRESFRPFAPSVLSENVSAWFDFEGDSPYMLMVDNVHPERCCPMTDEQKALFGIDKLNVHRSSIPAVTHVDYSARIQTVHKETNPLYHALISQFEALTGCPVLINTSFNVRGEPIVESPQDAFRCFMGCDLDVLVIGNCVMEKPFQSEALKADYREQYALD